MKSYEVIAWIAMDDVFCPDCRPTRSSPVFAGDEGHGSLSCCHCGESIVDDDDEVRLQKNACEELEESCRDSEENS